MKRSIICALLVMASTLAGVSARAYVFDSKDVIVEYWAGTGANEALCVVDFDAVSYAFGYRWEAGVTRTGIDMIEAIDAAGDLTATIKNFGDFGKFVDGLSYGDYSRIGFGDGDNWWHYWVSDDGSAWESPDYGASGRTLANGSWDGWGYGFAGEPDVPIVPEPSSMMALLALMGVAGSAKLLRRTR